MYDELLRRRSVRVMAVGVATSALLGLQLLPFNTWVPTSEVLGQTGGPIPGGGVLIGDTSSSGQTIGAPIGQGTGAINPSGGTLPGASTEPGNVSNTNPSGSGATGSGPGGAPASTLLGSAPPGTGLPSFTPGTGLVGQVGPGVGSASLNAPLSNGASIIATISNPPGTTVVQVVQVGGTPQTPEFTVAAVTPSGGPSGVPVTVSYTPPPGVNLPTIVVTVAGVQYSVANGNASLDPATGAFVFTVGG